MTSLVLLAASLVPASPPPAWVDAEAEFAAGVRLRADAAAARPHFAAAARAFDRVWAGGDRSPAVARARVAAHRLAGDLPRAVLAGRDGLAVAPWDADLRRMLESCRDAVPYPAPAADDDRLRPAPPAGLGSRVGPADLLVASALFSLLLGAGLAARLTTRPAWDTPALLLGFAGLGVVAAVGWSVDREWRQGREHPVAVVAGTGVVLRTGNAEIYPARIGAPLPRGAELAVLGERGGWLQVRVAGGAVGWVPGTAVLVAGDASAAGR